MSSYIHKDLTHHRSSDIGCLGIIAIIIVAIMLLFPFVKAFSTYEYVGTVIDKGYGGSHSKYIVWIEDNEGTQYELSNSDQLLRGKFNSSTIQGKLKEGSTYQFTVTGWRIPFFSEYPNIIDYELVDAAK